MDKELRRHTLTREYHDDVVTVSFSADSDLGEILERVATYLRACGFDVPYLDVVHSEDVEEETEARIAMVVAGDRMADLLTDFAKGHEISKVDAKEAGARWQEAMG